MYSILILFRKNSSLFFFLGVFRKKKEILIIGSKGYPQVQVNK